MLLQIALGTVSNLDEAVTWLSYTYLFVRLTKSPQKYGITYNMLQVRSFFYLYTLGKIMLKRPRLKHNMKVFVTDFNQYWLYEWQLIFIVFLTKSDYGDGVNIPSRG